MADEDDNCPRAANPDQADLDEDGQGDACDARLDRECPCAGPATRTPTAGPGPTAIPTASASWSAPARPTAPVRPPPPAAPTTASRSA
ncbi:MAG: hypothetical protein R3F60_28200 [bacterium]